MTHPLEPSDRNALRTVHSRAPRPPARDADSAVLTRPRRAPYKEPASAALIAHRPWLGKCESATELQMNAVGREIAAAALRHRARWRDRRGVAQDIRYRVDYSHEDGRLVYCTTRDPDRLASGKSGCAREGSA